MSDKTGQPGPLSRRQLRLVYVAGIALNVIALATVASEGQWVVAATFGVIIAYLGFRFRLLGSS